MKYVAIIKTNPEKEVYKIYTDDNGIIITSSSAKGLYNEVTSKYGKDEVIILTECVFIQNIERIK